MRSFSILKRLVLPYFKWLFKIDAEPAPDIKGPFLLLANHNADLDPVIINLSFRELIYFVASEHIFRVGFVSYLLKRYLDPISRLKGGNDLKTVKDILTRIKRGRSVCIFAEGNTSFNGETCPVPKSTGKLAKICEVPLVTYQFEGGYLTTPRWAHTMRRGRMRGYVVNVYPPEQLKLMTTAEVNAAIAKDLHEDAYARQEIKKVRFKGRRLAEGLEAALFICPQCESIGTLHSHDNEFSCNCGFKAIYDEYGYLNNSQYTTVLDWDRWQDSKLTQIAANLGSKEAFADKAVTLLRIHPDHRSEVIKPGSGAITMFRDRIKCGDLEFPISSITDMALYGRANITFSSSGGHYEIISTPPFCGRKYLELFKKLKAMR